MEKGVPVVVEVRVKIDFAISHFVEYTQPENWIFSIAQNVGDGQTLFRAGHTVSPLLNPIGQNRQ